ncbi:hypothetical protein OS493_028463 [Desmophyllum pertusum]|uniref:Lipase domain-containing protein n=1 Tax=Desmophyllum pertusum TaxID=174260 RepID=A0A9X0D1N3_9CNID|nr:hypothetical protein OS493_028463 [Desmophyllum pertusum]
MAFLLTSFSDAKEVCFNAYGCFSDAAPFDNPSVPLPQAPWVIWTAYKVFTRVHYETPQIIDDCDVAKLQASGYDGDKSTAILVHGFNGLDPARQYFEAENPNVRLNSTDAQFVDVIHTDSKTNGIERPVGDLDFYPNEGRFRRGVVFRLDHGKMTRLEVRHDGIPLITQWGLNWAVVKPAWGGDSNYYSACFDANLNSFGAARRLHQGRPGDIGCRL